MARKVLVEGRVHLYPGISPGRQVLVDPSDPWMRGQVQAGNLAVVNPKDAALFDPKPEPEQLEV